ncbi:MAG: fimbrillin family protein [Alistipes sp.]
MRKTLLITAAICILFAACDKGDEGNELTPPDSTVEPTKIPINISMGVWTRATDAGFENNDKAGIYVVNYNGSAAGTLAASGNHVDNMRFTLTNAIWNPDTPIYWKDQTTKADVYCYYPHTAGITTVAAYPFTVKTAQDVAANYKASDFLWGKTSGVLSTANPVQITVKHTMSSLLIYLKAGDGYTDVTLKAALKSIVVNNTRTGATIDLATGAVTATGDVANITPRAETDYYRALIVPQTISDINLITVTVGDNSYALKQSITFEANKQHKCTLTVNRIGNGINIGIGGWETDNNDHGGTVN